MPVAWILRAALGLDAHPMNADRGAAIRLWIALGASHLLGLIALALR